MNLHPVASRDYEENVVAGASICVAWLKVFKFLRLNMWLNMMTLTLYRGSSFLMGFLATFFVVLMGFIFMGLMVFGDQNALYGEPET